MSNSWEFDALFDKQSVQVKPLSKESDETVTSTILKLKIDRVGDSQVFLDQFQKITGIQNISTLFVENVAWDKIGFDCTDFVGMDYEFTVNDEITFDAKITRIDVSRKYKKGVLHYVYTITIVKESEPVNDGVIVNQYVKKFTRNAEDKKIPQTFSVIINKGDK